MRVPIKYVCDADDCDIYVQPDTCMHAIIGGVIFRFCSSSHRAKYTRARTQVKENGHAPQQV